MAIGLLGKKIGMSRIFLDDGHVVPVTVIHAADNSVLQVKTSESDGYAAVQVGYDDQKEQRVSKPQLGIFKKAGSTPKRFVREFRFEEDREVTNDDLKITQFEEGAFVDVIGTSKGKGFQGVVKRYNFAGSPMTHGSMMHRRPGAPAQGATPGRIWKNQKMPGQTGNTRVTTQNLKVAKIMEEDGVILISGAVPGPNGSYVMIRPSVKKKATAGAEA